MRNATPLGLLAGALLWGCVVPATSPSPSPVPTASASPSPSLQPSATPAPVASAVALNGFILGKLRDEDGRVVDAATVTVTGVDSPSLRQEVAARGGSYFVGSLPIGQVVKVSVRAPGYGVRERLIRVAEQKVDAPQTDFEVDFGGDDKGKLFALSNFPEITSTLPLHGAKDVVASPLVLKLVFSEPLDEKSRLRASSLLRLRIRAANQEHVVSAGSIFDNQNPTVTWNAEGTEATMSVPFPIVTREAANSPVILDLNPDVSASSWPTGASGKVLGRGEWMTAYDAQGGKQSIQFAPFWRDASAEPVPSASPNAQQIWGLTHQAGVTFTLAQPKAGLKLVSAKLLKTGSNDAIVVTFDRAVRGFPEEALDGSAVVPGNYRLVLGKQETEKQKEDFAKADPSTGGLAPNSAQYQAGTTDQVVLTFPGGTFGTNSVFKFYADGAIRDIAGQSLLTGKDPVTGRPASVIEGAL